MNYLQKECNTYRLFSKAIPLVLTMATFMLAFSPLSPQLFAQPGTIQIGSGTSTTSNGGSTIPTTNYEYSYSQQIVTATEYSAGGGAAGNITKIRWRFNTIGTTAVYGDWDVYIGHTTKTEFTSNTDWVPQADLTQVFGGNIHDELLPPTNGQWFEITFSTPFNYNGTDNIVIAVHEKTPNYNSSTSFYTYTSTANSGIVVRRDDGGQYDLANLPNANTRVAVLPQLQFEGMLAHCSGTPNAGTIVLSTLTANAGELYDVTVTGADVKTGLTFQWLKYNNTLSDWEDYGTASSKAQDLIGEVAPSIVGDSVKYRLKVTCNDGSVGYSDSVKFETGKVYCTTGLYTSSSSSSAKIGTVEVGGSITSIYKETGNTLTPGRYNDFTNEIVSTDPSSSPTYSVKVIDYSAYVKIWIDWNNNGAFEVGELVDSSTNEIAAGTTFTGTITIPNGTLNDEYRMRIRVVEGISNFTACSPQIYGEVEDYTLKIMDLPSCLPPSTLGATMTAITSATLSWVTNGANVESYDVEWGAAGFTIGAGTQIPGITTTSTTVVTNTDTPYEFYVRQNCGATDGNSDWRGPYAFKTGYCIPVALQSSQSYYVSSITTSGATTDMTYTANTAVAYVDASQTHSVTAESGSSFNFTIAQSTGTGYYYVWVDWNDNGVFTDTNENIVATTIYQESKTETFDIPATLPAGQYRVRVANSWSGSSSSNPCGPANYGNYVDFTLIVIDPPACSGMPEPGTLTVTPATDVAGSLYDVKKTFGSGTNASGLTYTWQTSTDGGLNWTNVTGYPSSTYADLTGLIAPPFGDSVLYKLAIACDNSGLSDTTDAVKFKTGYCPPSYTFDDDYTSAFSTSGWGEDADNVNYTANAQMGTLGYLNLSSDSVITRFLGGKIKTSHTHFGTFLAQNNSVRIWVDWNQNGIFEDDEREVNNTESSLTKIDSFYVPTSITADNYRMRLRSRWSGVADACGEVSYGQAIDFTINVLPCPSIDAGNFTIDPICKNDTVTLESTVDGGTWSSDDATIATIDATSGLLTGVSNGTANITYTVTDENGCPGTKTEAVTVKALPIPGTLTVAPGDDELCVNAQSSAIIASVTDGEWSTLGTNASVVGGVVTGLVAGTERIIYQVIDAVTTCSDTVGVNFTIKALPNVEFTLAGQVCVNGTVNAVLDGDAVTTGDWSSDNADVTVVGGVVTAGNNVSSANITYAYTDPVTSCIGSKTVAISVVATLSVGTVTPADAEICLSSGATVQFSSDGGSGGQWSSSNEAVATINNASGLATILAVGSTNITYKILASGGCSESVSDPQSLTVHALPIIVIAPFDAVCEGATATLTASGAGAGGTYAWDNGITSTSNEANVTATATSTTYIVTGTDANGCSNTDQAIVVGTAPTEPTFDPLDDVCQGATPILPTASTNATPIIGSWSNANTSTSGTKTLTFTPDAGQCASTTTKDLLVIAKPIVTLVKNPTGAVCEGTTVTLTASGAGVVTWNWTGVSATTASTTVTPNTTTSYSVTGTDANGCVSDEKPVTVDVVHPFVEATITGNDMLKVGDKMLYTGTPAGGTWSSSDDDVAAFVENTSELEAKKIGQVTIAYTVNNPTPCTGSVQKTKTITVVATGFSGVNDMEVVSSVSLFPNPASDEVNVEFTLQNNADVTVQIVDINGKVIETIMVNNATTGANSTKLNTTAYANGVYSVVLRSNNFLTTQRLVITK